MNAMPISSSDLIVEDNIAGSDSDTNSDDTPEYYQPISAAEDDDRDSDQVNSDEDLDDHAPDPHRLPNGSYTPHQAENGISSLQLSDEEEEDGEEASDSAIRRAFREDESRRNAPLTAENATRVMDAMRGVSFGGFAPDWAERVPEDQWIDRLRRSRQAPNITSTGQN